MKRRELLVGAAAVAMGTVGSVAQAAESSPVTHAHHSATINPYERFAYEARLCTVAGDSCVRHCLETIKMGDISLVDCLRKVSEMIPACDATATLAGLGSRHAPEYMALCRTLCEECEKECLKHKEHPECFACAKACKKTVREIDALGVNS